jgi:hypothetical protein
MPSFDGLGLSPWQISFATIVFIAATAILSAWATRQGRTETVEKPVVRNYAFNGQLTDMGPVRELIEGQGLLYQQMVRTNLALDAHTKKQGQTAIALQAISRQIGRLASSYEGHLAAEQTQDKIEEAAQALFERRLAQQRSQEQPHGGPRPVRRKPPE